MGPDALPRAVRERRPPPPAPAPCLPPPPGSQRARRAAGRPDAAREFAAGGPRRRSALFPRSPTPPCRRRPATERPHRVPHLRARRLPLLHLLNYKGAEGRLCPPGGSLLAGPAAPPAAASPAATAWLRAGDRVPPPLPRLSELLGSF